MESNSIRVAVIGYASSDYSMLVGVFNSVGSTTLVSKRLTEAWPEAGGIARILAGLSGRIATHAISWVGMDPQSDSWKREVKNFGGDTEGIDSLPGNSPSAYLFHDNSGNTECFFDPGLIDPSSQKLSSTQQLLLSRATHVVAAIGPEPATRMILKTLSDSVSLIWVVKADPDSLPLDLRTLMFLRANVVIFSHQEDRFLRSIPLLQERDPLASPFHEKLIIKTAGSSRIEWSFGGVRSNVSVTPIIGDVNSTGAGDFFAGAFVADYLLNGNPDASIRKASQSAFHFLQSRKIIARSTS